MPVVTGQAGANATVVTLFNLPPGESVISINSSTASAAATYIGVGSGTATTGNGYVLDVGHTLTFATYAGSSGGIPVTAITSGPATTVSWVISRPG